MQNTDRKYDKQYPKSPLSPFKRISDKLREKDEIEVRSRLSSFVEFALYTAAAYMLASARLPFSAFPLCISLLCSHRKRLLPSALGIAILAAMGGLPQIYIFTCIAVPLVRILISCLPSVFAEMGSAAQRSPDQLIEYNPALPDNHTVKKPSNARASEKHGALGLFEEKLYIRALTASACGLLAGIFRMISANFSFYSLWGALVLTAVCPVAVILLAGRFGGERSGKIYPLLSLAAIFAGVVYASGSMTVIGLPMSPFIALLFTLYATSVYGLLPGGITAIGLGLIENPVYMPLLLICSLLFFLVSTVRRNAGLAVVCAAVVVWCYYIGGTDGLVGVLPPMLLAIPVYMIADKYREIMCAPYDREAAMAGGVYFAEAVTEKSRNEAVKERLGALSEVFATLSETLYKLSDKRRRPDALGLKRICEAEFEASCKSCRNRELCYGSEYKTVLDAIGHMTVALHTKGSTDISDFDESFRALCPYADSITKGIDRSLRNATESMIKSDRLGLFASSYEDINEILRDALEQDSEEYSADREASKRILELLYEQGFRASGAVVWGERRKNVVIKGLPSADKLSAKRADDIRCAASEIVGSELGDPLFEADHDGSIMRLSSRPIFRAKCAHGSVPAECDSSEPVLDTSELYVDPFAEKQIGDEVCGDTANCFITPASCFYSLISDGMGSGEEAAFVSGVCSMFVDKMLSAGNRADMTVRMLNNLLRNENMSRGGECSATVDLCELDLITGTASFIKSGAAPTYIARGGTVYKVHSKTMPIGILKNADTKISKFDTRKGDIIIMMSDGCCPDSEDCPWLVEFLCEYMARKDRNALGSDAECEALKERLLKLAVKNSPKDKPRDDISVSVIMVE